MSWSVAWPWPVEKIDVISLVNSTPTDCVDENHLKYLFEVAVLTSAAALVLLLNFLQCCKRRSSERNGRCLSSFCPDMAIPVDFLSSTPYRFIYCLILSCWAADTFQDIWNLSLYYRSANGVIDAANFFVVSPTVIILRQALIYFPVLACVDSPFPLVGHYLGFIYTLLMGCGRMYGEYVVIRGCSYKGQLIVKDIVISLSLVIPIYLSYLVVVFWFFWHASLESALVMCTKQKIRESMPEYDKSKLYTSHVKELLKNKHHTPPFKSSIRLYQYLIRGLHYVLPFKSNPQVHFPLPFLASLTMTYAILYQICIVIMSYEIINMGTIIDFIDSFNITVETVDHLVSTLDSLLPIQNRIPRYFFDDIFYDVRSFALTFQILLPFTHWVGFWLCVLFTCYMVQNFHKHLVRANEGDLSFLLTSEPLPSLYYRLAAIMRYIPFQIGHILLGFAIYSLIVFILGVIGYIYYFLFRNFTFYGIHMWCLFMIPYIWAFVMHGSQLFLCRYVFTRKNNRNDPIVHIRFRRFYLLLVYIFMFFNVVYSVAMAFLRVLAMLVFSLIMLFRLDVDIYMRRLEGWDLGYRTYVSYIYLEYSTNNPVLRTFVDLLIESSRNRRGIQKGRGLLDGATPIGVYEISNSSCGSEKLVVNEGEGRRQDKKPLVITASLRGNHRGLSRPRYSRQARNRWLVAYTLLRNPGLMEYLGRNVKKYSVLDS